MKKLAALLVAIFVLLIGLHSAALATQEEETADSASPYPQQAAAGDAEVQLADELLATGRLYFFGNGAQPEYTQASAWFLKAAELGNAEAQYYLGLILENAEVFLGEEKNDYKQAEYWYRKAAEQGHAKAQINLGYLYCDERFEYFNYAQAAVWFGMAAAQGDILAQYTMGYMYENAIGVDRDSAWAIGWYLSAAEQGFVHAQTAMGTIYYGGDDDQKDCEQRIYWFTLASERGEFWAQYCLGEEYDGKDYEKALYWFARSAAQGHYTAECRFMMDCEEYYGVSWDDIREVERYLRDTKRNAAGQDDAQEENENIDAILQNAEQVFKILSIEAELGYADSQSYLGLMYEYGIGVAQDYAQAIQWYQKAIDRGDTTAMCYLGLMYAYGNGVTQDEKQALQWYQKAAGEDAFNIISSYGGSLSSVHFLGTFYANRDAAASAAEWYKQAAEQGNVVAMRYLALLYDEGDGGMERDEAQAVYWYTLAAEQGDAIAQYALGTKYQNGRDVKQDTAQAIAWYSKAADQGNTKAMCSLGDMYRYGKLAEKDYTQAMAWYRRAAELGDGEAQYWLGIMYKTGSGVAKNFTQALQCFLKAEQQGYSGAEYDIGYMYRHGMGAEQDLMRAILWFEEAGINDDYASNELYCLLRADREFSEQLRLDASMEISVGYIASEIYGVTTKRIWLCFSAHGAYVSSELIQIM